MPPCRRAGAALPGRFAETVGLDDSFDFFFLGRIPTLARAWQEGGLQHAFFANGCEAPGLPPSILLSPQDCLLQSCCHPRIASFNPVVTPGLPPSILARHIPAAPPAHRRTGFFSWEESRHWRGLGRLEASMPCRWVARPGGYAKQAPSRTLTVPEPLLYVLYVLYGSHKASH